jgi:hypothetical protein
MTPTRKPCLVAVQACRTCAASGGRALATSKETILQGRYRPAHFRSGLTFSTPTPVSANHPSIVLHRAAAALISSFSL